MIEHGGYSYGLIFPASYISKSNLTFFGGFKQYSSSIQQTLNLDDIKPSIRVSADQSVFQDLLDDNEEGTYIECFKVFSYIIFNFSPEPFEHFPSRLPMPSFNFNKSKTKQSIEN